MSIVKVLLPDGALGKAYGLSANGMLTIIKLTNTTRGSEEILSISTRNPNAREIEEFKKITQERMK